MWCKPTKGLRLKEKGRRRRKKLGGEKGKKMENKKIALGITVLAVLAAVLAVVPSVSAYDHDQTYNANATYFVDESIEAVFGESKQVAVWANVTVPIAGGRINLNYSSSCANITDWQRNTTNFAGGAADLQTGNAVITFTSSVEVGPGLIHIGDLTIKCVNSSYCQKELGFVTTGAYCSQLSIAPSAGGGSVENVNWVNGTFTCKNIPDLVVTDVSPQVVDPAAGTYTVSYTVKNVGNAAAGPFWVNLTVDGTQKATEYVSGGLAAGDSYTGNFSSHIETVSGDSDIVMVCADYNNTVDEKTYENNNCMSKEFFAALTVDIGNYTILPGGSKKAPITVRSMKDYGSTALRVAFNNSVVEVTGVSSSTDSTVVSYTNLTTANANGFVNISAMNTGGTGSAKDVILAYVTFHDISGAGNSTVLNLTTFELKDINYNTISTNDVDGSITIRENDPPKVTDPRVSRSPILNYAGGRGRPANTYTTTLSVNVTDAYLESVTIDLSSIGGGSAVPMTKGTGDTYYVVIDSVNGTNIGTAGVNETHCFLVNATDTSGNSNTLVCIGPLEILRRGDVVRDNVVDMGDALYIARWSIGLETVAPGVFVGDVVGAGKDAKGDGKVDMGDALYIARYTVGNEVAP